MPRTRALGGTAASSHLRSRSLALWQSRGKRNYLQAICDAPSSAPKHNVQTSSWQRAQQVRNSLYREAQSIRQLYVLVSVPSRSPNGRCPPFAPRTRRFLDVPFESAFCDALTWVSIWEIWYSVFFISPNTSPLDASWKRLSTEEIPKLQGPCVTPWELGCSNPHFGKNIELWGSTGRPLLFARDETLAKSFHNRWTQTFDVFTALILLISKATKTDTLEKPTGLEKPLLKKRGFDVGETSASPSWGKLLLFLAPDLEKGPTRFWPREFFSSFLSLLSSTWIIWSSAYA